MCIIILKKAIPEEFRGLMSKKIIIGKEFLIKIEKRFAKNKKAKVVQS